MYQVQINDWPTFYLEPICFRTKQKIFFFQVSVFNIGNQNSLKKVIIHFRRISILSANCVQKHHSNLSRSTCKFWEQLPKNQ